MTYRYPPTLRRKPITSALAAVVFAFWFGARGAVSAYVHGSTRLFVAVLVVAALLTAVGLLNAWTSYFLLHRYTYADGRVEQFDGLLRRRRSISLSDVHLVRDFTVLGSGAASGWIAGHMLVSRNGAELPVIESLPFWGGIEAQLRDVPRTKQSLPWRWVL